MRALAAQVALDRQVAVDRVAELHDLVVGEVLHVRVGIDTGLVEHLARERGTDAVDVRETDLYTLIQGDVDAGDTCHLALPLLMPRVLADHEHRAMAANDLALLAHWLN